MVPTAWPCYLHQGEEEEEHLYAINWHDIIIILIDFNEVEGNAEEFQLVYMLLVYAGILLPVGTMYFAEKRWDRKLSLYVKMLLEVMVLPALCGDSKIFSVNNSLFTTSTGKIL